MFFNRDILIRRREEFHEKGVKFNFIGDLKDKRIPEENKKLMKETENLTHKNKTTPFFYFMNKNSKKRILNFDYIIFGSGAGSFTSKFFSETGFYKGHSHNIPLEIAFSFGIPTAIIICITIIFILLFIHLLR